MSKFKVPKTFAIPEFKVPKTFTIPDTIDGVAGLLNARGWERAALVYAYTKPGAGQGTRTDRTSPEKLGEVPTTFPCSMAEFARLEIVGLSDEATVKIYRDRWAEAMRKRKARAVKPGDTIEVPDLKWEPTTVTYNTPHPLDTEYEAEAYDAGITKDAVRRVAANKAAVKAAIKADPTVAETAREALNERLFKQYRGTEQATVIIDDWRAHRQDDSPADAFDDLVRDLRSSKSCLQLALGAVLKIHGFDADERRHAVIEYIAELRNILDAIEETAHGRSFDEELAKLLEEEVS